MKTKQLLGLVAVVAVVGLAGSAQAGVTVNFSLGLPLPVFHAPRTVVVVTPPCPPPVAYCPPLVVYQPVTPRHTVVYVAPQYKYHDNYRNHRGYEPPLKEHGQQRAGRR